VQTTDCLILDVRMPGMTGPGLQRELRFENADLPIIFMTAYENPDLRAQVIEAGAVAFLYKPFYEEDLLDAINAALRDG
jgi:FixJ family two-component response regulator